jgi:hypothetical protein
MVKSPKISAAIQKEHTGQTAISLNGKIIGIGKDSIDALKKAKLKMPDIENTEFLISHIYPKYIAA